MQLENFIGSEITYMRGGSRLGWKGVLQSVEGSRATVLFDNGTPQEYSTMAFLLPGSTDVYVEGDISRYLKVSAEPRTVNIKSSNNNTKTSSVPLSAGSYLIVNLSTHQVVGSESTLGEAELFASEQAQDSVDKDTFAVCLPGNTYRVKPPVVTRIKGLMGLN